MLEENPLGHISVSGTCSVDPTHTIGTKEDYYEMGAGQVILQENGFWRQKKAQVHRSMIASSPTPFSRGGKWLLRDGKCLVQSHTASGWKSQDENTGS